MSEPKTTIPKGSLVLVTGATGYVGSQVTKQFLQRGYKVRGTVRDVDQASWLVKDLFKTEAHRGLLELVAVPDLSAPHAFDGAVKGVSAIAHIASVVTFDADPNKVIPQTVAGISSLLEAAAKEPSVKELVYTSSIVAATPAAVGNYAQVGRDTWNEAAVEAAWAPPPYTPNRGSPTYAASKVAAEKEVWRFAKERKPHFNVNVVNPAAIIGEPLHRKHTESVAAWVSLLYNGVMAVLVPHFAKYFVDVKDIAVLHVAAILDPEVKNARIQAWGHCANWNDLLPILRKLRPQRDFIPDFADSSQLTISTDQSEGVALLKKWAGQDGWKRLVESVTENINNPFFE